MKNNIIYAFLLIGLLSKLQAAEYGRLNNDPNARANKYIYWLAIIHTDPLVDTIRRQTRRNQTDQYLYNASQSMQPNFYRSQNGRLYRGPYHGQNRFVTRASYPDAQQYQYNNADPITGEFPINFVYNNETGEYIDVSTFNRCETNRINDFNLRATSFVLSTNSNIPDSNLCVASCAIQDAFHWVRDNYNPNDHSNRDSPIPIDFDSDSDSSSMDITE